MGDEESRQSRARSSGGAKIQAVENGPLGQFYHGGKGVVLARGAWVVGREPWVVRRGSWIVGREP